jgi:hypothetical protein
MWRGVGYDISLWDENISYIFTLLGSLLWCHNFRIGMKTCHRREVYKLGWMRLTPDRKNKNKVQNIDLEFSFNSFYGESTDATAKNLIPLMQRIFLRYAFASQKSPAICY